MIEIDGSLISESIIEDQFVCNLNACKGACCWEGDYGAPLDEVERDLIIENLEGILPYLDEKSKQVISKEGGFEYYEDAASLGTSCHSDGSCVFLTRSELGIAQCGIEKAYNAGDSKVNKPISCHLYPIRVQRYPKQGFEAWNYDEWDICSAACAKGKELNIPIYQFVKDAIIRYKGEEFYDRLHHTAEHIQSSEQ